MATISGSWKRLKPSGAGSDPIVMTGEVFDSIIAAMNAFAAMEIAPTSNCAVWTMNDGQAKLDLMSIDGRLKALESGTGIGSGNTIVNVTYTNTSLAVQIANINARLDAATASVNCVANVAVVTFHI